MLILFHLILLCYAVLCVDVKETSDEIDPVLYYLLNDEYQDGVISTNNDTEPIPSGVIWKCGQCENVTTSRLVYRETNIGFGTIDNTSGETKIGVVLKDMKCVIVRGSVAGLVKQVDGECEGSSVTLTLVSGLDFVLDVYGE